MRQRVNRFPITANVIRKKARKKLVRDQRQLADQAEANKLGITVEKLRWKRVAYWSGLHHEREMRILETMRQARLREEERRNRYSYY